jgi:uncharacterized protein (DUF2141 family)
MKTTVCFILAAMLVVLTAGRDMAQTPSTGTGTLVVMVSGLENTQGQLLIGLYRDSEEYDSEKPVMGATVTITGKDQLVRFEHLPYGQYAVVVLHDLNKDMEMQKNFLGIPQEGYGFSNNVMGSFGPPSFEDASFYFAQNYSAKIIDVHYGISR